MRVALMVAVGALSLACSGATGQSPPGEAAILADCAIEGLNQRARCGTVRVPESADAPKGRQIDLRIIVAPARNSRPARDPIVPLVGGPGQGAADLAAALAQRFAALNDQRALVFIDQRGTGQSNGLHCAAPANARALMGKIFDPERLQYCRDQLAGRADLTQYTTSIAAADYERVFDALGYQRVNLIGVSYGSRMGLELTRRFPTRVRTLLVDGVVPPGGFDWPTSGAADADAALRALIEDCRHDRECQRLFPDAAFDRYVDAAFAALARKRVDATVRDPRGGQTETVPFGVTDLAYATRGLLYGNDALWLPTMFRQAGSGVYDLFAQAYVTRARTLDRQIARGVHLAVYCAEDLPFVNWVEAERLATGTRIGTYLIDQYRRACEIWPRAAIPAAYRAPVTSDVPVLLMAGRRDPVTPPRTAEQAARTLSRSRVVVWPYGGHGTDGLTSGDCRRNLTRAFVDSASVENLPVDCINRDPAPFRVPGITP